MSTLRTHEALLDDDILSKPSLRGLSFALRHPEVWPEGFEWDYTDCTTCAIGLAFEMGMKTKFHSPFHMYYRRDEIFDIERQASTKIFVDADAVHPDRPRFDEVTPIHVADLIDAYLADHA